MMHRSIATLLVLAVATAPFAAAAQNPQSAPPGATAPMAPPNSPSPPPEKVAPRARADNRTLSDQLSRQGGTLRPKDVDPGINVTPPANRQGAMPVIPPPGSRGGNEQVVPK
jgi:hypothetical protein